MRLGRAYRGFTPGYPENRGWTGFRQASGDEQCQLVTVVPAFSPTGKRGSAYWVGYSNGVLDNSDSTDTGGYFDRPIGAGALSDAIAAVGFPWNFGAHDDKSTRWMPTTCIPQEKCPFGLDALEQFRDGESVVYLVAAGEHAKIGVTTSVPRRLGQLQIGSPVPLEVLGVIRGDEAKEKELHERFSRARVRGEWFERYQMDRLVVEMTHVAY